VILTVAPMVASNPTVSARGYPGRPGPDRPGAVERLDADADHRRHLWRVLTSTLATVGADLPLEQWVLMQHAAVASGCGLD
jgi:hypothetical protein